MFLLGRFPFVGHDDPRHVTDVSSSEVADRLSSASHQEHEENFSSVLQHQHLPRPSNYLFAFWKPLALKKNKANESTGVVGSLEKKGSTGVVAWFLALLEAHKPQLCALRRMSWIQKTVNPLVDEDAPGSPGENPEDDSRQRKAVVFMSFWGIDDSLTWVSKLNLRAKWKL